MAREIDDEMLMAAADGELETQDLERIEEIAAKNPAIARRLEEFRTSAEVARAAFAGGFYEPVPPRLIEAAGRRPQRPVDLATAGVQPRHWLLAASVAVFAFVGGYLVAPTGPSDLRDTARMIAERLEASATGTLTQVAGFEAGIVASYETSGGYCRQIAGATGTGEALTVIACHGPDGWAIPLLMTEAAGLYAPASATATAAIEGFLDAVEAATPLAPADESAAIARGWARP